MLTVISFDLLASFARSFVYANVHSEMISSAGSAVHRTSSRVLPWIGGPSLFSSPGRIRNFHTENRTTVSTSTKIGTEATSRTSYNVLMFPDCLEASAGNQG